MMVAILHPLPKPTSIARRMWFSANPRLKIGLSPANFGPFSGYRAKLCTRVILGPAQRHYIEKATLPPKSAPQNKIGLKFLLQKVEIFRRQPSPVSIGLSPICSPVLAPSCDPPRPIASSCTDQPRRNRPRENLPRLLSIDSSSHL